MSATAGTQKHSVTMPPEISEAIRERVGARGFSSYVALAVDHQLKRDALADVLADMEAEHGPVDEGEVDRLLAALVQ